MTPNTKPSFTSPLAALAAVFLGVLLLAGCATPGNNTVDRTDVGQINEVEYGEVVAVRPVTIDGSRTGVGTVAGAIIGGAAGSEVGGDGTTNLIVGVVGAVIGGIIGNEVEREVTKGEGFEYTIRLDNGRTITVVQAGRQMLYPGDRVEIVYGGRRVRINRVT